MCRLKSINLYSDKSVFSSSILNSNGKKTAFLLGELLFLEHGRTFRNGTRVSVYNDTFYGVRAKKFTIAHNFAGDDRNECACLKLRRNTANQKRTTCVSR